MGLLRVCASAGDARSPSAHFYMPRGVGLLAAYRARSPRPSTPAESECTRAGIRARVTPALHRTHSHRPLLPDSLEYSTRTRTLHI
jgi:hypothetical protein